MRAANTRVLAAAATALVVVAFAGCGGNEEKEGPQIPRAEAAALINRLEEAQRRSDPFRCNDLQKDTIPALERQLKALPDNVDADVRSTVEDGIAHLSQLVDEECANNKETKTETTPTTPAETQTTPAPTQTQTQPPKTTPAPTTPAPTTPAPENPGGGGSPAPEGNGNGAANPGNGKLKKPKGKPAA
jgi:hypothetical protein